MFVSSQARCSVASANCCGRGNLSQSRRCGVMEIPIAMCDVAASQVFAVLRGRSTVPCFVMHQGSVRTVVYVDFGSLHLVALRRPSGKLLRQRPTQQYRRCGVTGCLQLRRSSMSVDSLAELGSTTSCYSQRGGSMDRSRAAVRTASARPRPERWYMVQENYWVRLDNFRRWTAEELPAYTLPRSGREVAKVFHGIH